LRKENEKGAANESVGGANPAISPAPLETPFERFEEFARKVVSVPKSEVDEQERRYKEARKRQLSD
jgi:hypothetical protein